MIRPIVAYGATVLKKKSENISEEYPNLSKLIEDMWETMYASKGVGLAAPQIGLSVRIFVIDTKPFASGDELDPAEAKTLEFFKKVFINPQIIKEEGDSWSFNEGCLSIPEVREDVNRKEKITIQYRDEKFKLHTEILDGLTARVVHRIGFLTPGENIVFVGVSSKHRKASFEACEYIMDYLKTQAPFWKREETAIGKRWVEAREQDEIQVKKWGKRT